MGVWYSVDDKIPDVMAGKYRVRRRNGIEMDAFFYMDKMGWIAFYGQKTSHWWDANGIHERLDDITHWMEN